MTSLAFIAAVIDSLAWPAALLAVLYIFKGNIAAIFPYVQRLKYKDFEVHFQRSMEELAEKSKSVLEVTGSETETPPIDLQDHLYRLAEISPRSAVLEAWINLEAWAKSRLMSQDIDPEKLRGLSPMRLGRLLESESILNEEQLGIFHELRELRNQAVHVSDKNFPDEAVDEYIDLSLALARAIRASSHPAHPSNQP